VISSQHSQDDALLLQQNLGFNDFIVQIEHKDLVKKYNDIFSPTMLVGGKPVYNLVADENIQARIRGTIVMHFSNAFGAIPIATGNKSELSVGYCTLYGDMCGGFAPISDVYKMDVYALAEYYNNKAGKSSAIIPPSIIEKVPSAELSEGQEDSDSLLPYPILDILLFGLIEHHISNFDVFCDSYHDIIMEAYGGMNHKRNEKTATFIKEWIVGEKASQEYNKTIQMVNRNEFKRRQAAPGIKVSKVAFGSGRRMPITKK
jgi:NAD+ synthase (glutamine-hydrolysing)